MSNETCVRKELLSEKEFEDL
jgi:DNA polymerase elongation subunit (family B)